MACWPGNEARLVHVLDMEVAVDKEKLASLPVASQSLGLLVGLSQIATTTSVTTIVTGYCACTPSTLPPLPELKALGLPTPDWEETREVVARHFPVGCVECGVWVRGEGVVASREEVEEIMRTLWVKTNLNHAFKEGPILVVVMATASDQSDSSECCYEFDTSSLRLGLCGRVLESKDVDNYLRTGTAVLRVQASLSISILANTGGPCEDSWVSALTRQMDSSSTIFYLPSQSQLLLNSRPTTLANVLSPGAKKDVCQVTWLNPVPVEVLQNVTMDTAGELPTAPVINFESGDSGSGDMLQVELPLDMVCVFGLQTPIAEVARKIKEGTCAQIKAIADTMSHQEAPPSAVLIRHLPLPTHLTPVTVVCPRLQASEEHDRELEPLRRHWHRLFGLPEDRPFFRTTNREFFAKRQGPHLLSPHTAARQSRVSIGTQALVHGAYAYHHYMQDSFNDNGWGCAYRSLQTLWSWFLLQGYTRQPVPSHRQVQQVLVDVGDKQPSLIGSKEWIGSFEVATCLHHLLEVESKIHHCSSGATMAGVGRVLVQHFQTQGTPVMIGGGVLAHTILGVDFSESTGEIRFLVLDPHYTGKDDLKAVVDKGWCGWKPVTFWDQQAHYNLCMPQRPLEI